MIGKNQHGQRDHAKHRVDQPPRRHCDNQNQEKIEQPPLACPGADGPVGTWCRKQTYTGWQKHRRLDAFKILAPACDREFAAILNPALGHQIDIGRANLDTGAAFFAAIGDQIGFALVIARCVVQCKRQMHIEAPVAAHFAAQHIDCGQTRSVKIHPQKTVQAQAIRILIGQSTLAFDNGQRLAWIHAKRRQSIPAIRHACLVGIHR